MNFFSKQQDIQLGQEAAQQVRQQYQVVNNPFLEDYVKRVGERLAASPQARASEFPFNFTVLNDPGVNAFALPGGPMFIFTGLMKAADTEGQLAGVMAHEMSHVILRHGTHQASKANLLQLPAMLAGAVLGQGSLLGTLTNLGANGFLLKFSRDSEREADAMGAHLLAAAGYNPLEMASFFNKLAQQGGRDSGIGEFLSSHPNPGNREKAIQEEARALGRRDYGFQTGQFQRAKTEVAGVPQARPRTPNVSSADRSAGGSPPMPQSGGWETLQAQGFTVSYPGNWQVYGDRGSSMLTIAPREGLAQGSNGGTQIGFGAIVSYFAPENQRTNLRNATSELLHHLHAQNAGMQVVSNEQRRVRVGGQEGLVTMMQSQSPFGGGETDALVTVLRPEGLFYMVFIAPERDFARVENAFQQMMSSIRFTR
jgi:beta-barrel assembly-enhancing protease